MPARLRLAVLLSGLGGTAWSQQEPVVSLQVLVDDLLKNNPTIRAAQFRHDAATKRPSQLSTLPEPKVSYTNFGVGHPFSRLNTSEFAYQGFGFSQEIPYPGKLALAGEQARKEAQGELEMYRATVLDLTAELKVAYYDWYQVTKSIEIARKNRDLLERFEKIARARYSVGKGIQQDVLKAQVEQSGLAQRQEVLEQKKATSEARILALLNTPRSLGRPADLQMSPLPANLEGFLTSLDRQAPLLRTKQAMLDGRAVGVERSRKEYLPDFAFNFQWQKTGAPFRDYYVATAEMKLPLYFWRKQRLGAEEATARFQEARQNYAATRQELVFALKDLYLTARTSERLLALYQSGVIPQASLSLESAVAGYEVGSVDFLTLMGNFMSLFTYESQYYDELAKHEQAMARLEALVATPLIKP
jgi:outer membrane protein TolC